LIEDTKILIFKK